MHPWEPAPEQNSVRTAMRGHALLETPLANKGVAFSGGERQELGLLGLLPPAVMTMERQLDAAYAAYQRQSSEVDKHIFLRSLQDSNEVLFYSLLLQHIQEMAPIIYTPVVGDICQDFSAHYRRPRGLYLCYDDKDRIDEVIDNWPLHDVRVSVITDGERVLGLGDLGVGGMGIAIGKLALYSLCGGVHPSQTLPIVLDTGTDNAVLLDDPLYLGWRHPRIRGEEYDSFVEQVVTCLFRRFPHLLLQWEDFAKGNARRLLEQYQDRVCTFNDDIQGTAAVTLAGLLAAVQVTECPMSEQRILIVGAGSAGTGIGELIVGTMCEEGLSEQEAYDRIWMFNSKGAVNESQQNLDAAVQRFSKSNERVRSYGLDPSEPNRLQEVVESVHPTVLIGVSAQPGIFSEGIVRRMMRHTKRPIIFPLSNPTRYSEAVPEDLLLWTEGKALVATGSPFDPVSYGGNTISITQCNNALVFPGIGLGVISVKSRRVVREMLVAAAKALAQLSEAAVGSSHPLLPGLDASREIAVPIACAVAKAAINAGVADPMTDAQIMEAVQAKMWWPQYPDIHRFEAP